MFIGLCGSVCAGKHSIADYLIYNHGFKEITLSGGNPSRSVKRPAPIRQSKSPNAVSNGDASAEQYEPLQFEGVDALVDFVTLHSQERWVIAEIWNEAMLDVLSRRPFFLLVSVDAPATLRYSRYNARCEQTGKPPVSLPDFVSISDEHMYYHPKPLGAAPIIDRATLRILNSSSSLSTLHKTLAALNLPNEQRLRPSWDQYFMQLASLAAHRSNCMKRRVGCVLVREMRVISTGYNGTPRGLTNCNQGGCPRCNGGQKAGMGLATCLCLHAEENALLEAGRERIREGAILYCDTCPCLTCSVKIAQVGITEVVYSQSYNMDAQAAEVLKEAGVHLRQFSPPQDALIPPVEHSDSTNLPIR